MESKAKFDEFMIAYALRWDYKSKGPVKHFNGVTINRDRTNGTLSISNPGFITGIYENEYMNDIGDSCRSRVRWNCCTWRYMDLPSIFSGVGFPKKPTVRPPSEEEGSFLLFRGSKKIWGSCGGCTFKKLKMYYKKQLKPISLDTLLKLHTKSKTRTAFPKFKRKQVLFNTI